MGGALWEGGAESFLHSGANRRWSETLSEAESAAYEKKAVAELGSDCAGWLLSGKRP